MDSLTKSNYDAMRDLMEIKFLDYDQAEMIDKFGLLNDDKYLYISFVGTRYRIDRFTGKIEYKSQVTDAYTHADYNVCMTIFDVLCDAKKECHLSGSYVSLSSLKNIVKTMSPGSGLFIKERTFFTGKCEQLGKACESLGGIRQRVGDVSYEIPLFDFMSVILQFWDADEEFEAVLKIMWDENILDYMHFETTFFATSHLLGRLMELCGK